MLLERELIKRNLHKSKENDFWGGSRDDDDLLHSDELPFKDKHMFKIQKNLRQLEISRFFFETRNLEEISPAALSKFSLVYIDGSLYSCYDIVKFNLKKIKKGIDANGNLEISQIVGNEDFHLKVNKLVEDVKDIIGKKFGLQNELVYASKVEDGFRIFQSLIKKAFWQYGQKKNSSWNGTILFYISVGFYYYTYLDVH